MKKSLLIVFGLILTVHFTFGQSKEEVQLPSLRVSPDEAKHITGNVNSDLLELRKGGVLRATKGNHIVYHKKLKKVVIKPIKLKPDLLAPTKRDDILKLGDWVLVCAGECGTCAFGSSQSSEGTSHYCVGCDECFHFVLVDPNKNRQYETQDGSYDSNWSDL